MVNLSTESIRLGPSGWIPVLHLLLHPTSEHTYLDLPKIGKETITFTLLAEVTEQIKM